MIYLRLYIEPFNRATSDLSMVEDGAYNRLLRHYYQHEKPLPLDPEKLVRIARAITEDERAAVRSVLAAYFTKAADGWHNERADEEIRVANTARANGAKGGNPWVKEHYNEPGFVYAIRGREAGTIKLGITVDPKRRTAEHRREGCGEVIVIVPVARMGEAEKAVLEQFAPHANGEWLTLPAAKESLLISALETFRAPDSVPARVPKDAPGSAPNRVRAHSPKNTPKSAAEHKPEPEPDDVPGNVQPLSLTASKPLKPNNQNPKTGGSSEAENTPARASTESAPPSGSGATAVAPLADEAEDDDGPVPQGNSDLPWWLTPAGFQRQAPEVKVRPRDDEEFPDFAARVCAASGPGPWDAEAAPAIRALIPHYRAPGAGA